MIRFGQSQLTIQYFSSWKQLDLKGRSERLFEVFYHLIERLYALTDQPVTVVREYCLGSGPNEHEGRLLLCCNRYRESGMTFWNWSFIKCFDIPSEFIDEGLDGLFQVVSESVLPFRTFHKQSLAQKFQLLYQVKLNVNVKNHSIDEMALKIAHQMEALLKDHFPNFIWTFDEIFDRVSLYWKCPILKEGSIDARSSWVRPHWFRLQRLFEESWEDFRNLRYKSFQFGIHNHFSDFIQYPIDNFLPCNGVGRTFEFKPWKSWSFKVCSIAFFCKQRTRSQWGVHPFLSCLDTQRSEEDMQWFGSDLLTVRFVFQQPGGRRCDTFIFDAECGTHHLQLSDKECRSSLLWLFGHAVEQCLLRQVENIVFDELKSASYGFMSPFSYMERLDNIWQALNLPDQEIFPMCFPQFELPIDTF
jgi:hypothetical protein